MAKKAKRPNPAAVAMAKRRAKSLTAKRREEIARNAANQRWHPDEERKPR